MVAVYCLKHGAKNFNFLFVGTMNIFPVFFFSNNQPNAATVGAFQFCKLFADVAGLRDFVSCARLRASTRAFLS